LAIPKRIQKARISAKALFAFLNTVTMPGLGHVFPPLFSPNTSCSHVLSFPVPMNAKGKAYRTDPLLEREIWNEEMPVGGSEVGGRRTEVGGPVEDEYVKQLLSATFFGGSLCQNEQ
jgi:hypothetical protein